MVFSSATFLFLFLPVVIAAYLLAPRGLHNAVLIGASLFFYLWGEPHWFWVLLASVIGTYWAGFFLQDRFSPRQRKGALIAGLVFNLGLLGFFKYANFLTDNFDRVAGFLGWGHPLALPPIHLPIGISFFTFQALSFLIDVYRGTCPPQLSFPRLLLFKSMFPQLIAGPIVRYKDVARDLKDRNLDLDDWTIGAQRFIVGLARKLILANPLGAVADQIFALPSASLSTPVAWLGLLCYTLQLYYDFSGYSDMAIGLGRMFGFTFPENFNFPYCSRSIQEFWRRWHMSLSAWFRDYLYIPLGGNRHGTLQTGRNLLIVFGLCGFWHGASWNFVVWGFFHGFFLIVERVGLGKLLERCWPPLAHGYALLVVGVGWVFFRSADLPSSFHYLAALFGHGTAPLHAEVAARYLNGEILFCLAAGIFFAGPAARLESLASQSTEGGRGLLLRYGVHLALLMLCLGYVASSTYNPFIYFRF